MTSTLFTALLSAALGVPGPAEKPALPGAAPTLSTVGKVDADKGEIEVVEARISPITEYRTIVKQIVMDGKVVNVTEAVPVTVMMKHHVTYRISLKGNEAVDGTGKKLTDVEVAKRLKVGDTLLRVTGEAVDPMWLKVLKPDVVILLTKEMPAKAPPVVAPPPKN